MFGQRKQHAIALFLLPALLAFSVQTSLEVLHPIEEHVPDVVRHDHPHSGSGPAVHDSNYGAFGVHDHRACAHWNAVAYVATLQTSFQRLRAYAPIVWEVESVVVSSRFTIFDRGPPLL